MPNDTDDPDGANLPDKTPKKFILPQTGAESELSGSTDDPNAKAQAKLEEIVEGLRAKINEERFIFVVVSIVLFDAFIFQSMNNWGSPIALLLLEVAALIVLARRLNVGDLLVLINSLANIRK